MCATVDCTIIRRVGTLLRARNSLLREPLGVESARNPLGRTGSGTQNISEGRAALGAGSVGTGNAAAGRSGSPAGDQGVPPTPLTPNNLDEAAAQRQLEAKTAHAEYK
jgi:hypothetical protein